MAILLSFICPGLGHVYTGKVFQGLILFVLTMAAYMCLFLPGLIIHLFVLLDAGSQSNRVKNRDMQRQADLFADAFSRKR